MKVGSANESVAQLGAALPAHWPREAGSCCWLPGEAACTGSSPQAGPLGCSPPGKTVFVMERKSSVLKVNFLQLHIIHRKKEPRVYAHLFIHFPIIC